MVRCLDPQLDRTGELIAALDSLLRLWPLSDEVRRDLAYLRLLEKTATPDDLKVLADVVQNSPWLLAHRVAAALACLREKKPREAMEWLEKEKVPWDRAQQGWRAVYAAALAANDRVDEAKAVAVTLSLDALRPGERQLVVGILPSSR